MPSFEIKNYDYVMIDGQNVFNQPVQNNIKTYNNILKITAGEEFDCITGCLLLYPYFNIIS